MKEMSMGQWRPGVRYSVRHFEEEQVKDRVIESYHGLKMWQWTERNTASGGEEDAFRPV